MNIFERLIHLLQYEAPRQTAYNWFHLMFIGLTVVLTVLISVLFRNADERKHKCLLFSVWLVMLVFEIYKQLVLSFNYNGEESYWEYSWYSFPFQFCSSPLYVLPLAVFVRNKKANEFFESFLGLYAVFGGLIVMIVPGSVFSTSYLGVAIQTMVHHSLMIVSGVYIIVRNRHKLSLRFYLKGSAVFAVLVVMAIIFNETLIFATDSTVNMFFISRHVEWEPPVFADIYAKLPYLGYLALYIFGFMLIAFLIFSVSLVAVRLSERRAHS